MFARKTPVQRCEPERLLLFSFFCKMNSLNFNIDNGYLEGLVRGFKAGILKHGDYANLVQCETLEGK